MLYLLTTSLIIGVAWAGCPMRPLSDQSSARRTPGDGGYFIKGKFSNEKYLPDTSYTISLHGPQDLQQFSRFTLSVDSQHAPNKHSRVGHFELFNDPSRRPTLKFHEECMNTVTDASDTPISWFQVMWRSPPRGSGCVVFTAMVYENPSRWFAEDGNLTRTVCEMSPQEIETFSNNSCCACDDAKYSMTMVGLWSNLTHPKDFPISLWLTHFSDLIGATHEPNFSFWGPDHIATDGFRQLAEWGSTSGLESELKLKAKHLRTFIKAAGLWYPNVNGNTSATFRVDKRHPILSVASMFGPSPDWVVGLDRFSLCLKDCSWLGEKVIDLYPWDAGTDNGISYMSPNSETKPREKMKPITSFYPEDPRSPFYDPTGRPMLPLAKIYLTRQQIYPRGCNEPTLEEQVVEFAVENTEESERPECLTTEYSPWSDCSVSCGKGLRMRSRDYRMPEKAAMMGCNRQLISKEMCVATAPECPEDAEDSPFASLNDGSCLAKEWGDWSECSVTCGKGVKMRNRKLVHRQNRKKCSHMILTETVECFNEPCTGSVEQEDPLCKVTDWSVWSPCSRTCGAGVTTQSRLLMNAPDDPSTQLCLSKVQLTRSKPCEEIANCTFDAATAKVACMEAIEVGPCRGAYLRWAFDSQRQTCISFYYGGCRGTRNNFENLDDCRASCSVLMRNKKTQQWENANGPENELISGSPVDCLVSHWSPWTDCNVTCGTGRVFSSRTIERQPRNGGAPCPTQLRRSSKCMMAPCY